ncbi:hypothetical protein MBLNU13_g02584t1 [Cladosporium sp. NU13]
MSTIKAGSRHLATIRASSALLISSPSINTAQHNLGTQTSTASTIVHIDLVSQINIVHQKHIHNASKTQELPPTMKLTQLIAPLALASNALAWRCLCGYSVNRTTDQHFSIFTHIAETDFLHTDGTNPKLSIQAPGWAVDVGNKPAKQANATLGSSKQLGNVVTNPLPKGEWGVPPAGLGDAGLQLWVRHGVEDGMVPVAGVRNSLSLGHDGKEKMLYGSYRAGIKFSGVNGTRGTFGWESKEGTRKQSISMTFAANAAKILAVTVRNTDSKYQKHDSSFEVSFSSIFHFPEEFHELRFDFLPDRIDFYIDDHLFLSQSETVPTFPGSLSLKHYVDDGLEDPPAHDAVMTVSYVKAYYNTTTHDEPLSTCSDVSKNTCVVPDQHTSPDPKGKKTHFYSPVADDGEAEKHDHVNIGHVGYGQQPDKPKNVASAATLWNGMLFAGGLLLVAIVRFS